MGIPAFKAASLNIWHILRASSLSGAEAENGDGGASVAAGADMPAGADVTAAAISLNPNTGASSTYSGRALPGGAGKAPWENFSGAGL